jgi:hypothetical protein
MFFRDSDHATDIREVLIKPVNMSSLSTRLAVSTKIGSPHRKVRPRHVVGHMSVPAAMLADSMN